MKNKKTKDRKDPETRWDRQGKRPKTKKSTKKYKPGKSHPWNK
jgi:hypothetical protein